MPSLEKISITLPADLVAQVQHAVETGEYSTSSEVVRDALSEWNKRRQVEEQGINQLRSAWREACQDERPGLNPEVVFSRLKARYSS